MKKNCDFYMDKFFALDKNERLPASLTAGKKMFQGKHEKNFMRLKKCC